MKTGGPDRLAVAGIGSMVVDRVHRVPRILKGDEKGLLRGLSGGGSVGIHVGGVVLNHLGWAAALGLRAGLFGRQGDDDHGRFLRAAMDRLGIERDIRLDGTATAVAEIFVDDAGSRSIYMAPGATAETTPEKVREHAAFIRRADRLSTEVSQLPLASVRAALEIAHEAGVGTVVDLDLPPSVAVPELGSEEDLMAVLRAADVLKPTQAAAAELLPGGATDALVLASALRERFECEAVVVTDGERGCAIAAHRFEGFVPARRVKALDTTGAGDAFLGGLLVALHHGLDWENAGRLANAAGAACVEKLGAFPDDPAAARARVLELYSGLELSLGPLPAAVAVSQSGADEVLSVLDVAVEELGVLRERLRPEILEEAVRLLRGALDRGRRLHVTGVGKPEHVARYAASLLSSTGTPATFLHATECVHGSSGQVVEGDVVVAISNSGETEELRSAVRTVRRLGARILAVTGDSASGLASEADVVVDAAVRREGGGLGLAPNASVAAELLVLAGLAAALEKLRGFRPRDYNLRHPAGALGKRSR